MEHLDMSFKALMWAVEQVRQNIYIDIYDRAVLFELAERAADRDDSCYPSLSRLIKDTRISENKVRKSLNNLQALGLIIKQERASETGSQKSNLYTCAKQNQSQK